MWFDEALNSKNKSYYHKWPGTYWLKVAFGLVEAPSTEQELLTKIQAQIKLKEILKMDFKKIKTPLQIYKMMLQIHCLKLAAVIRAIDYLLYHVNEEEISYFDLHSKCDECKALIINYKGHSCLCKRNQSKDDKTLIEKIFNLF